MGTSLCEPHIDIVYDVQGRKGPYAHYYIQVQPNGGSFVGMFDSPLLCLRGDTRAASCRGTQAQCEVTSWPPHCFFRLHVHKVCKCTQCSSPRQLLRASALQRLLSCGRPCTPDHVSHYTTAGSETTMHRHAVRLTDPTSAARHGRAGNIDGHHATQLDLCAYASSDSVGQHLVFSVVPRGIREVTYRIV